MNDLFEDRDGLVADLIEGITDIQFKTFAVTEINKAIDSAIKWHAQFVNIVEPPYRVHNVPSTGVWG